MSASKKINLMALIRTLTISTTTFERMKEKFYGFRQTEYDCIVRPDSQMDDSANKRRLAHVGTFFRDPLHTSSAESLNLVRDR